MASNNELKVRNKGIVHTTDEWTNSSNSNYKGNATLNKGELAFTENDSIVTDMKIGDGTSTWGNLPYYLIIPNIKPIIEKTYTGVVCSANTDPAGYLYFGAILPDSYTKFYEITYKITVTMGGSVESNTSYVKYTGIRNSICTWTVHNTITNGSYRAFYNHVVYRAKEAGITGNYGHILGLRFYSSWNPATAANARTVKVEIMNMVNCSFSIYNSMMLYANITGNGTTNYDGRSEIDGTSSGFKSSGDNNDTSTMVQVNTRLTAGTNGLMQYSLCMMDSDGKWQSFTTNSGTGTKTKNTAKFNLGQIFYLNMSGNVTSGNITGTWVVRTYQGTIDLRYSTNCGTTLTANKMVYIVGTIKDGLFELDSTWYTQTLPTTPNGKVYIPVGMALDTYRIDFFGYKGAFYHNGTSIASLVLPPLTEAFTGTGTKTLISTNGSELKWRGVRSTGNVVAGDNGSTFLIDAGSVYSSLTAQVISEEYNPSETVTANWDFKNNNPSTMSSVNIQGTNATGTILSDVSASNSDLKLTVNASESGANIKLQYNSSGYAQFNAKTRIQVPVRTNTDVITVVSYPGQHSYTVGGTAAASDTVNYSVTSTDVAAGHVDIIATGTSYLYSIKLVTVATGDNWFDLTFLKSTTGLLRLLHKNNFQISQSATETKLKLAGNGDKGILRLYNGNYYGDLIPTSLTTNRTWTLPDSTGTIATEDYVQNYVKNGLLTLKVGTTQIGTFSANQATSPTWTINKTHITNLGIEATDEKVKFNTTSNGWYKIPVVKNMLLNNEITTLLFNDNDSLCIYTSSNSTYLQLGDCLPPAGSEDSGSTSQHKGILRIYNGAYVDFSANTLTENQYAYFPNHSGTLAMIDSWTNNITSEDVGAYLSATIQINGVNKYIYAKASGAITEEYGSASGSTRTLAFVNQDGNNPQNILFNRGLTIQIKDGKVENNVNTAGVAYLYLGKKDTTNGHQEGQFRLFGTNGYYVNVRTLNLTSDVAITLPNETSTLAPLLSDYVFLSKFPSGKNFNEIATYGNGGGYAVDVTSTDSKINPPGTTASDDYTFLNLSYKIKNQSAYYVTQIVNKAGTADLWVRSRNGSAISDSSDWVAPWTRILTGSNWKFGTAVYPQVLSCTVAAGTAAKTVTLTGFELVDGAVIRVKFTNGSTVASATLNVNSTGAKNIRYRGSNITANDPIQANEIIEFVYNATDQKWDISNSNILGFKTTATTNLGVDSTDVNQAIGYVNGLTKAAWNYQQVDGALYRQVYSASWIAEIFQDYRTGQISLRGRNNGTWQSWRRVVDESNWRTILSAPDNNTTKYLRADGTWVVPPGTYTHPSTTTTSTISTASPAHGGTFTAIDSITVNNGHVTGINTKTITLPDDLTTITKTLTITTSWVDTGISGINIPDNGSYIVQVSGLDSTASGTTNEIWTGVMSWCKDTCSDTDTDEIILHKAGQKSAKRTIYLRTIRQSSGVMKLQISSNIAFTSSSVTFKFKKII